MTMMKMTTTTMKIELNRTESSIVPFGATALLPLNIQNFAETVELGNQISSTNLTGPGP